MDGRKELGGWEVSDNMGREMRTDGMSKRGERAMCEENWGVKMTGRLERVGWGE